MSDDKKAELDEKRIRLIALLIMQYYKSLEKKRTRRNLWNMFCVGCVSAGLTFTIVEPIGDFVVAAILASGMAVFFHYTINETLKIFLPESVWDLNTEDFKDER